MLKWSEVPADAVGQAGWRAAKAAKLSNDQAGVLQVTLKEAVAWLF